MWLSSFRSAKLERATCIVDLDKNETKIKKRQGKHLLEAWLMMGFRDVLEAKLFEEPCR